MPLGGLLRDLPLIDDPHRLCHGNSTELRRFSRRTRLVGHHRCVPVLRRLGSEKAQRAAGDQRLASPTEFEPVLPLGEGGTNARRQQQSECRGQTGANQGGCVSPQPTIPNAPPHRSRRRFQVCGPPAGQRVLLRLAGGKLEQSASDDRKGRMGSRQASSARRLHRHQLVAPGRAALHGGEPW